MSPIKLQGTNSVAAPGLTNDGGDGVVVGTDSVDISTGGTSRVKVDSAGKVGIGTTTNAASEQLTVLGSTSSEFQNGFYRNYTTGARGFNLNIGAKKSDGTLVAGTQITGEVDQTGCTSGQFAIKTLTSSSLTEKLRVDSSGNLTISDGDLKIGTAGHGIDFSATSDATGKTSELLDDYEEGTFTPAYIGGVDAGFGYGNQDGTYVKIGKMVYWDIYINGSSGSSNTGHLAISGFPFTQSNVNARGTATFGYHQYAGDYHLLHQPANTYLYFYDGSSSVTGNTALATGDAAHISGSYQAA
tara:strand:+ start:1107 stop:2006 length:900 start_codon:yes stop_codon:yes gene_type:complete